MTSPMWALDSALAGYAARRVRRAVLDRLSAWVSLRSTHPTHPALTRPKSASARLLIGGLLVAGLSGCASVRTLDAAQPGAPVVYAGTRLDLYALGGGCCARARFGAEAPKHPGLDLAASALLDTLLLPLSLATALGVSLGVSGGL